MTTTTGLLEEPKLNAGQAAAKLGISRSQVYELAKRGELPHVNLGGRLVFVPSLLERWLRSKLLGAPSDTGGGGKGAPPVSLESKPARPNPQALRPHDWSK